MRPLQVPANRLRVNEVQRGSIIASMTVDKGKGPTPQQLADQLIQQVLQRDARLLQSAILQHLTNVKVEPARALTPSEQEGYFDEIVPDSMAKGTRSAESDPTQPPAGIDKPVELQPVPKPVRPKRPVLAPLDGGKQHSGVVVRRRFSSASAYGAGRGEAVTPFGWFASHSSHDKDEDGCTGI
jgi:hypothetical protein